MKMNFFVLLMVFGGLSIKSVNAGYDEGLSEYNNKNYKKALVEFNQCSSDAKCQFVIGLMHDRGEGVTKNYKKAIKWYRLSAEQGYTKAMNNLALNLDMGYGVPQSSTEATKWWFKAATEQGDADAQITLGFRYSSGLGVPRDLTEARKWFRVAAESGYSEGQYTLGRMLLNGQGGFSQDEKESVNWFRLAAEQGNVKAQSQLGELYLDGQGVTKNDTEALRWFRLAADQGNSIAQYNLGNMFRDGRGVVNRDDREAAKWYRLASEQGNENAQSKLGYMYYSGFGVDKDLKNGTIWSAKAAQSNNKEAISNLERNKVNLETLIVKSKSPLFDRPSSKAKKLLTLFKGQSVFKLDEVNGFILIYSPNAHNVGFVSSNTLGL